MRKTFKEFLLLYAPLAICIVFAAGWFSQTRRSDHLERVAIQQRSKVLRQKLLFDHSIEQHSGDAVFLARFIAENYRSLPSKDFLNTLLADFSLSRKSYINLFILDKFGREFVRANTSPAGPVPVPEELLQDRNDTTFFRKGISAPMGSVYISDLDLNVKMGRISSERHPMLRFASPIRNDFGTFGLVVLSLDGDRLLTPLTSASRQSGIWLLDSDGYWLVGPTASQDWGLAGKDGSMERFRRDFPHAWDKIMNSRFGQFNNEHGMFTFNRLSTPTDTLVRPGKPMISPMGHGLRIVSFLPEDKLVPEWYRLFFGMSALLLIFLGLALWRLASLRVQRLEVEQSLRDNEKRLKAITTAVHDAIAVLDPDGRTVFWNPAAATLFGYDSQAMLGSVMAEVLTGPDSQASLTPMLGPAGTVHHAETEARTAEIVMKNSGGAALLVETTTSFIDLDGQPHTVVTMRDVTDRRAAEKRLRESEHAARALLNATPDAAILLESDGTIVSINEVGAKRLGRPPEKLVGQIVFDLLPPDVANRRREHFQQTLAKGTPGEFHDERSGRKYHSVVYPFSDKELNRAALFARDVTEELKNRERAETLSKAVEQSSAGVFITDRKGTILYVNPRFTQMTGYDGPEAIGATPKILDGPDGPEFFFDIWPVLNEGRDWRGEVLQRNRSGEDIWVLLSVSPVLDEQGELLQFVGVEEDITTFKKTESALRASEQRFRDVSEAVGEFIWEIDNKGYFTFVTNDVYTVTGYTPKELIGLSPFDFMPDEDSKGMERWFRDIWNGHRRFSELEHRFVTKDGTPVWMNVSGVPYWDDKGNFKGVRGASMDISDRKESEEALRASEEKLRALAEAAYEAIIMIDSNGTVIFWNNAAVRVFGYTEEEAMGSNIHDLVTPPEEREQAQLGMYQFAFTGQGKVVGESNEVTAMRKDGSRFPGERSVSSFHLGNKWYAVSMVRDISERKEAELKLQELATTDALTDLYNRRHFMELAEQEFAKARRYNRPFSLFMLDLDHFKNINDSYGHDIGDLVLADMAHILDSELRETDIPGRIGGEEFAVALPETEQKKAVETAERLRRTVEEAAFETPAGDLRLTISIGVTSISEDTPELKSILRQADKALYRAKGSGRNRVCHFADTES